MAFNGSGVFVRIHRWATDLAGAVPVTASRADTEDDGFATGLSNAICRDGQSTTTARIPFAAGTSAAAGTTAAVAYAQTNDTNTGMYFPATDSWGLVAGGTAVAVGTATGVAVTGTFSASGAATLSGAVGVTGDFAVNTNKFTVAASSGNTLVAGTLAVTGASTLTGNVGIGLAPAYALTVRPAADKVLSVRDNSGLEVVAHNDANNAAVALKFFALSYNFANSAAATFTGAVTVTGLLTASNGFTVSAGAVALPAGSVADAALAAPGCMKLILKQTASNSATIDFTVANSAAAFNGTYDRLILHVSNAKPATDDVEFWMRVGTGAGPTYQSGAGAYSHGGNINIIGSGPVAIGSGSDTKIVLTRASASGDVGNATGENFGATIEIDAPDATDFMLIDFRSRYIAASALLATAEGAGCYMTAGAVTALRCMFESGNIASGVFSLYGVKNA